MNAIDIIRKKITTEGSNFPRDLVVAYALGQIDEGSVKVFQYGPVVFTVSVMPEYPVVHMYADDAGHSLIRHTRKFMSEVWSAVPHKFLVAPILLDGVKALVRKVGWKSTGRWYDTGHELFIIERD